MLSSRMRPSVIAFTVMTVLAGGFLAVLTARELNLDWFPLTQHGESSLGPHSVDKLGITAFAGAVLICLL